MALFNSGDFVWIPDPTEVALPAKVSNAFTAGQDGHVTLLDSKYKGQETIVSAKESAKVVTMDAESTKEPVADMVKFNDLKEESILHNLRERYRKDLIYTAVGDVLVSVNPFKLVPLYSPDKLLAYAHSGSSSAEGEGSGNSADPHVYALASRAYRAMVENHINQSCLVSGESGAGKSEVTKLLLQFFAEMSNIVEQRLDPDATNNGVSEEGETSLNEKILKASPLLESFGNAKTVRNRNSSRFGKWIEIRFSSGNGNITGGTITQYLLEKTRIVHQGPDERNYHIFYQLCAGAEASSDIKKRYRLLPADQYTYLGGEPSIIYDEEIKDQRGWDEVQTAMKVLNFSVSERDDVLRTVSSVLNLGNVEFETDDSIQNVENAAKIAKKSALELAAYQLGLNIDLLEKALVSKELSMKGGDTVQQRYTVKQAEAARDVLAKAVYASLFDWLVRRINISLNTSNSSPSMGKSFLDLKAAETQFNTAAFNSNVSMIGVLDIFGFESFESNSFEQLCINYCNERLQSFFTEHVFKLEQEEYGREGVKVEGIEYIDNTEIVNLIDKRREGIMAMINEEGNVPKGSDETFMNKMLSRHGKHPNFVPPGPKESRTKFGIVHFAGEVSYDAQGFLEKNRDTFPQDLKDVVQQSTFRIIQHLFEDPEDEGENDEDDAGASETVFAKESKSKKDSQLNGRKSSMSRVFKGRTAEANTKGPRASDLSQQGRQTSALGRQTSTLGRQTSTLGRQTTTQGRTTTSKGRQSITSVGGRATNAGTTIVGTGKETLGSKFQAQLNMLVNVLEDTQPHFVRCLKPNGNAQPNEFDSQLVLTQLRYSGLLGVCRIRQQGYPARLFQAEFAWRYRPLLFALDKDTFNRADRKASSSSPKSVAQMVAAALERFQIMPKGQWLIGHTKVLMKSEARDALETARTKVISVAAVKIQSVGRRFVVRLRQRRFAGIIEKLETCVSAKNLSGADLREALTAAGDLPNEGQHLQVVKDASELLRVVEEEDRLVKMIQNAIESKEAERLRAAISSASSSPTPDARIRRKSGPGETYSKALKEANSLLKKLEAEDEAKKGLLSAIESRDLKKLKQAISKAEKATVSDKVSQELEEARAMAHRLEEETSALKNLEQAIKSKKNEQITEALSNALRMGLGSDPLIAKAQEVVKVNEDDEIDRTNQVEEVRKMMKMAAKEKDRETLAEGRKRAVELGITGDPELQEPLKTLAKLDEVASWRAKLVAAGESLDLAMKRGNGVNMENVTTFRKVAEEVHNAVPDEDDLVGYTWAIEKANRAETQVGALQELRQALDAFKNVPSTGSEGARTTALEKLREIMRKIDDLGVPRSVSMAEEARAIIRREVRTMKQDYSAKVAQQAEQQRKEKQQLSDDHIEKDIKDRRLKASNAEYHFSNFYRLRTDADFARGILFNKNKPIDRKLKHQNFQIHKSLLDMDDHLSRQATTIHKSILGYCGDNVMPYPATLAQSIMERALLEPGLWDEIYVQLLKHLTDNSNAYSVKRAWQLVCIAVGTFPPTPEFELYLLNFLLGHEPAENLYGRYAAYALRRLNATILHGPAKSAPTMEEIQPYADRPPVLATIELVDGTPITNEFPIAPHMNVDAVLRICVEFLAMNDARSEMFGMFVTEHEHAKKRFAQIGVVPPPPPPPMSAEDELAAPEDDARISARQSKRISQSDIPPPPPPPPPEEEDNSLPPRSSYPLRSTDFLGDVVLQLSRTDKAEKFVFKRKIFLPEKEASSDPVYNRLMYLQALDEIISGNWEVRESDSVVELAAIAMLVDLQANFPSDVENMLTEGVMDYIPVGDRHKLSEKEWAQKVLAKKQEIGLAPPEELELLFLNIAMELPMWGMLLFLVRIDGPKGSDHILAIDCVGIHLLDVSTKEELRQIRFADIKTFGGGSERLYIDMKQGERITVWTSQSREIASLIVDLGRWVLKQAGADA